MCRRDNHKRSNNFFWGELYGLYKVGWNDIVGNDKEGGVSGVSVELGREMELNTRHEEFW